MKFNEPKNLLHSDIENQSACDNYQPIGTGDCWGCGHPFFEHWQRGPICCACYFCPGCKIEKPASEFSATPNIPALCKTCDKLVSKGIEP